ncbi:MAG: hypothetical protein ACLFQV_13725, partial [Vulcanimicrobiota bacterium]
MRFLTNFIQKDRFHHFLNFFLLTIIILGWLALPVNAQGRGRRVLGLFKSTDNATAQNNAVRNYLGRYLVQLGYRVDYRDALKPLPSKEEMAKYDAVVTFYFNGIHPHPNQYINWLNDQLQSGRKVVIFGNFGAHSRDGETWLTAEELNDFFFNLGLAFKNTRQVEPGQLKIVKIDNSIVRKAPESVPDYFAIYDS